MRKKLIGLFLAVLMLTTLSAIPAGAKGSAYAPPATEEEIAAGISIRTNVVNAQIVNGDLYLWGSNTNSRLGITSTVNPDNGEVQPVAVGDVIAWPTKLDRSVFGGSDVVKFFADWAVAFAITADGGLYGWGNNSAQTAVPGDTTPQVLTPKRIEFFNGLEVLEIRAEEKDIAGAKVRDPKTNETAWYLWGGNGYGELMTGDKKRHDTPVKVNADLFPGESIVDIQVSKNVSAVLTDQGNVYTTGSNTYGMIGNNLGHDLSETVDTSDTTGRPAVLTPSKVVFGDAKIVSLTGTTRILSAVDEKGRVWTWGMNGAGQCGINTEAGESWADPKVIVPKPTAIFGPDSLNSNTFLKKARAIYTMGDMAGILCADNTVYLFGSYYLIPEKSPKLVMESVSKKETIIGISQDGAGVTLKTKEGNSYFCGKNSNGGAGTGTTDGTLTPIDTPVVQEPENLPPVKPMTLNKIYMDIEYTDKDTDKLTKISGAAGEEVSAKVNADQRFTVKVYFEDFAKLHQFTLPIKYTTDRAKIVYKDGTGDEEYKPYAGDDNEPLDSSNIVKFGVGSGLQSNVRDSVWQGGQLVQNDSYPRVNNQKGYVSVKGVTTTQNASISGKQLMFSIDFIGTSQGEITFKPMDADMTSSGEGDPVLKEEGLGATWQLTRELAGGFGVDTTSFYSFNEDAALYFPKAAVTVTPLKKIDLSLMFKRDGESYAVSDTSEEAKADAPDQKRKYFVADKSSTDTFTVVAEPTPKNATAANVDSWSIEFDSFTGAPPADKQVSDYVEVIRHGARSYSFKMAENTMTSTDGYFVIQAKKAGMTIEPVYLKVTSMRPPEAITIANASACPDPFLVRDEKYANAPLKLLNQFTFKTLVKDYEGENATGNLNVTWTLYNCVENEDGTTTETVIANNDLTAPAVISGNGVVDETVDGVQVRYQTATVKSQRTTPDGSYVKIKCVSTAGDTVSDEATFRVELLATGIVTDQKIYLGKNTSRKLKLSTEPFDAYEPEYEITVADDSPAAQSEHGSYISVSADGLVSAGNEFPEDLETYDEIVIREKKSDAYYSRLDGGNTVTLARIKVHVMNIIAPPDMDVEAQNNVGIINDRVLFHADLKEGDKLTVYKEFMNPDSNVAEYASLTATQIAELNENGVVFEEGLSGTGGTVGYLVERAGESFTEVPVDYTAEACVLKGYVRLEGKVANSPQNADITVEIQGLRDADGNPIEPRKVQDETGYFEFENYVPVGSYTIKLSRDLYITRYVTVKVTGTSDSSDIVVSTLDNPVYLAPGDLGNPKNGRVDPAEFQSYLYNWVGKVGVRGKDIRFDDYNFAEPKAGDNVIGMYDTSLMLRYYNKDSVYRDWMVTQ